jgi:VWFA-related protein
MALATKLLYSLTLAASVLPAQAPPGLIRLNVTALDSGGEPVDNLTRDDFQISDQGKPQKIAFFRQSPGAAPAVPLAPHEYSNRSGGASPHSTVILFDLLNENQSDRLSTWHQLGKSLQQLESGDSIFFYLLTLEGALSPIHAISKGADDDKTWTQAVEKTLDKAMKAASHAVPAQMNDKELVVKKTYVALETLANQLLLFPGRRDIIWITSATPNVWNTKTPCNGDWVDCALYVPHLAVTLAADNVAVNPLAYTGNPSPDLNRDLEMIAGLTGGWSYFGEDIRSVLKQLGRNAAHTYSICYDLSADSWDSKFHKVRVNSERKGVKLRVKQRYYALPDRRPEAAKQQPVLAAAFQSPSDDPGIGLRASFSAGHVQFRIDPSDLLLREEGNTFSGTVTFLIADVGPAGPIGDPMLSNFPVHLSREQYATAMKEGIPIAQDHAVNNAIQKLRVIVLDQGSNVAGSLTIPVPAAQ